PTRRSSDLISAGAALPAHTALRFRERAAEPVRNFYGASECGAITYDRSAAGAAPPGCVGTPLAGVRLSVAGRRWVTPSTGGEAPRGRIVVEGRAVALGYVRAGVRPRPFHRKFLTGDLGRIDGSGRLFLEGRLDQMINVGGRKVFPAEVERVLG